MQLPEFIVKLVDDLYTDNMRKIYIYLLWIVVICNGLLVTYRCVPLCISCVLKKICNRAYRGQLDRWWCQRQCIELRQFIIKWLIVTLWSYWNIVLVWRQFNYLFDLTLIIIVLNILTCYFFVFVRYFIFVYIYFSAVYFCGMNN